MEKYSTWMTYLGTFLTLIQTIILFVDSKASFKLKEEDFPKYHRRRMIIFVLITSWLIIMSILLAWAFIKDWSNFDIIGFGFLFALIIFVYYAHEASHSFDTRKIYPPKTLWQVLFKRIPSWIKDSQQTVFKFLVLKMDNTKEVEQAAKTIEDSYKDKKAVFEIKPLSCFDYKIPNEEIEDDICGIICLIGKEGVQKLDAIEASLEDCSNKPDNLDLPIAYSYIACQSYRLKYEYISESLIGEFAQRLIMRSYRRSREWIRLSEKYHKVFIASLALILLMIVGGVVMGTRLVSKDARICELNAQMELLKPEDYIMAPPTLLPPEIGFGIDSIDLNAYRNDSANMKLSLARLSDYTFKNADKPTVKIWVRTKSNDKFIMRNIFSTENDLLKNVEDKEMNSVIGGVAQNQVFVLWPQKTNRNNGKCYIWNKEGNEYATTPEGSESVKFEDGSDKPKYITWQDSGNPTDNGLTIYAFSYDGVLAVELDYADKEKDDMNWKKTCEYLKTKAFRDEMRVFYVAVACELLRFNVK